MLITPVQSSEQPTNNPLKSVRPSNQANLLQMVVADDGGR